MCKRENGKILEPNKIIRNKFTRKKYSRKSLIYTKSGLNMYLSILHTISWPVSVSDQTGQGEGSSKVTIHMTWLFLLVSQILWRWITCHVTYVIREPPRSIIDLTDYSPLPNSFVSMLPYFRITGTDGNYIPMFSSTKFFSVHLRFNYKVVIQRHCVKLE